jgi:hypothetical protein
MSTTDRTFDDVIRKAKALLENHDDDEYEALKPSEKANYQEALEFLRRLESSVEIDSDERLGKSQSPLKRDADGGTTIEAESDGEADSATEIDTDLESTMGDDGNVIGPFDGHDVVVYDPEGGSEGWISMTYDATIPFEDLR